MRLTVLGCGTGTPSGIRSSAGFWVETGSRRVRLDCGAGTVHAMARYGLAWEALTHQFVSHFHVDHCAELPALLFAFALDRQTQRTEPLALVGPRGLEYLIQGLVGTFRTPLLKQRFPIEFHELAPGDALDLGEGVRLRVAKTPHTGDSLAVRIDAGGRSVGYTGDTGPSDEVARLFDGVDLLVAECSYLDDKHGSKHLLADETAELARTARVGHLVATHFYFDPEAERLAERLARGFEGRITIAYDGLTVEAGGS